MTGLPTHASVVVMGCSTLYHLARDGVADAVLVERDQLTSGATWHSAAQVRTLRSSRNITDPVKYSAAFYAAVGEDSAVEIDIARRMSPGRVSFQPAFDPTGARMRKARGAQP